MRLGLRSTILKTEFFMSSSEKYKQDKVVK